MDVDAGGLDVAFGDAGARIAASTRVICVAFSRMAALASAAWVTTPAEAGRDIGRAAGLAPRGHREQGAVAADLGDGGLRGCGHGKASEGKCEREGNGLGGVGHGGLRKGTGARVGPGE